MPRKNDDLYFDNFVESAAIACEAAEMLKSVLENFDVKTLPEKRELLHEIEHRGDNKKHEMTYALVRAFITPIERNDIMKLSQTIDDVTDSIEDIIIHIYMNNITVIRKDSIEFAELIISCCNAMKEMLKDLRNFSKSKKLNSLIIEINRLEEVGDDLYINNMRHLHTQTKDMLEIIAWREIYGFFERCADACEDVADIVESITINNS